MKYLRQVTSVIYTPHFLPYNIIHPTTGEVVSISTELGSQLLTLDPRIRVISKDNVLEVDLDGITEVLPVVNRFLHSLTWGKKTTYTPEFFRNPTPYGKHYYGSYRPDEWIHLWTGDQEQEYPGTGGPVMTLLSMTIYTRDGLTLEDVVGVPHLIGHPTSQREFSDVMERVIEGLRLLTTLPMILPSIVLSDVFPETPKCSTPELLIDPSPALLFTCYPDHPHSPRVWGNDTDMWWITDPDGVHEEDTPVFDTCEGAVTHVRQTYGLSLSVTPI